MRKTTAGSIAEFAGAFALMFVGGGGAILNSGGLTAVALATV